MPAKTGAVKGRNGVKIGASEWPYVVMWDGVGSGERNGCSEKEWAGSGCRFVATGL
jgi:hypothetical protein